ncbi:MAG: radical SAM protein [Planctomycetota bacterium]
MSRRVPRALRVAPKLKTDVIATASVDRTALLINPFYPKDPHASFGKHVLTPTLALTSVAAATPPDWSARYWDENLLGGHPPFKPFPQVVGISVHLTFARRAYELARWYRERGAIVVFGGLHVMSCPEECRPHADALVFGEGSAVWPRLLADITRGTLQPEYHGAFSGDYATEPAPRRSILDRRAFLTTSSFNATRGCHSRCGFCYLSTRGLTMPYKKRRPEQVAEEFVADDQPYGVFTDNNLGSDIGYLHQLCRRLQPLRRIWSAAVSIDTADDPSVIRAMARAGCMGVFIGFETLNDANLEEARKKTPRVEDYARRVRIFHENGIQVNGSFVLGFDADGPGVFDEMIHWIEAQRLECATFHILTPYPGTPFFTSMKEEGRILHQEWDLYDTAHVVFRPKRMSVEELERGYERLYERLFSFASIWHRRPENPSAVLPYLGMSTLYKKCNWLWPWLIRTRMTSRAWRPLMEWTRRRHFRRVEAWDSPGLEANPVFLPVPASV